MRGLWVVLIGSICVFAVLGAGCGGGSGDSGPTKAAFVKRVNAICAQERKKASAEFVKAYETAKVKGASTEADAIKLEVQVFVPVLLKTARNDIAAIRSAGTPAGDESQVNGIVKDIEAWIAKAEGAPLKVVIANDIFNDAREKAKKYGLDECATTPFEG